MRKFNLILTATLAIVGAMVAERAQAAVVNGAAINANAVRAVADDLVGTQNVQFYWGGRRYCWYEDGWHGPGWYWCGYHWRRGFGWGGPIGWRGWRRPGIRPGRPGINRPGRPGNRPGINRPGGNRPGMNRPGGNRPGAGRPGGGRPGAGRPGGGRPSGNRGGRGGRGGGGRGGRQG
jgi:hypothetical protein